METLSVDATAKFYEGIFSTLGKDGQESVIQSANVGHISRCEYTLLTITVCSALAFEWWIRRK